MPENFFDGIFTIMLGLVFLSNFAGEYIRGLNKEESFFAPDLKFLSNTIQGTFLGLSLSIGAYAIFENFYGSTAVSIGSGMFRLRVIEKIIIAIIQKFTDQDLGKIDMAKIEEVEEKQKNNFKKCKAITADGKKCDNIAVWPERHPEYCHIPSHKRQHKYFDKLIKEEGANEGEDS